MNFTKTLSMAPLVLGFNSLVFDFSHTNFEFNESEINKSIGVHVFKTDISDVEKIIFDKNYMRPRFFDYLNKWRKETKTSSNVNTIITNKNFIQIVSLDRKAIPLILEEINRNPSNLVWALNLITNKKISNQSLTIEQACRAWIKWGGENSLI